ncbi:hypothetical protein PybrP1_008960, partial [[Pythium] brassicae (nom. inval.)]
FYAVAQALARAADSAEEEQEEWREAREALRPALDELSHLTALSSAVAKDTHFRLPRASELLLLQRRKQRESASPKRVLLSSGATPPASPRCELSPRHSTDDGAQLATELSSADFRAMLEHTAHTAEKLSTQDIRRRLGLVDRSAASGRSAQTTAASEAAAREEQEAIQSDMMHLAKELKQRTQTINEALVEDVKILDAVGQSAESNTTLLDRENAVLKQHEASAIGLWTSLALVLALVLVFVATYLYIKLFSRRRW